MNKSDIELGLPCTGTGSDSINCPGQTIHLHTNLVVEFCVKYGVKCFWVIAPEKVDRFSLVEAWACSCPSCESSTARSTASSGDRTTSFVSECLNRLAWQRLSSLQSIVITSHLDEFKKEILKPFHGAVFFLNLWMTLIVRQRGNQSSTPNS